VKSRIEAEQKHLPKKRESEKSVYLTEELKKGGRPNLGDTWTNETAEKKTQFPAGFGSASEYPLSRTW